MKILVTGGAGYIGSNVAINLIDAGYEVTVIDDLSTGNTKLIPKEADFIKCNINELEKLEKLIIKKNFTAIMHFAAFVEVEESVRYPDKYFLNNYINSQRLFDVCIKNNLNNIVFSSTAAAYGVTEKKGLISENTELNPNSPYAESKIKAENYLLGINSKKLNFMILRYFNVAGADPKMRSGLISKKATHLIKIASEAALGKRKHVIINGNDYETIDGTAIRDYIHVSDLANIHIKSLEYLIHNKKSEIINCGYGQGHSVKEVLDTTNRFSKNKILIKYGPRRSGDVSCLIADVNKLEKIINWTPKYNNLEFIIKTAIEWEKKISNE